jgi:hypothetical protein
MTAVVLFVVQEQPCPASGRTNRFLSGEHVHNGQDSDAATSSRCVTGKVQCPFLLRATRSLNAGGGYESVELSRQRVTCALEHLIELCGRLFAVRKAGFHCVQKYPRRKSKIAKNRTPN